MDVKPTVTISVRSLVEFVLRSGDICSSFQGTARNVEGIRGHQAVQKEYGEDYIPEVPVAYLVEKENISLEINGRIDGVIKREDRIIIDEIKTTNYELEYITEDYNPLHWAQAKCYAYIYADRNKLESITVQLTYYQLDTRKIKRFFKVFGFEELDIFFYSIVEEYLLWANNVHHWCNCRNLSITDMEFPFKSYRKGQRELAAAVFRTIRNGGKLFAQAPTGIGKTLASLFPAIKAMGAGLTSKIFYLTAKTITRTIAESALDNMRKAGLRIKSIAVTAKEKVCFNPEASCNPELCEYARGYYNRLNKAVEDIFKVDSLTRTVIEEYARKHGICPFEFSLDLSLWCDCIICDYNYVFDPRVYLKRYFMDNGGDYTFLIDEAHNLLDRAREMFSAEFFGMSVLELKKVLINEVQIFDPILDKINEYIIEVRHTCDEKDNGCYVHLEPPQELLPLLRHFLWIAEQWLLENKQSAAYDKILEFYFNTQNFIRMSELYDERYVTYYEKLGSDMKIKMFCHDPSYLLSEAMKRGQAAVLFSATLTPMDYFINTLGGDRDSHRLKLTSPFPRENLCLLVDDRISTKYRSRGLTYDHIVKSVSTVVKAKTGNYIVYFPSYQYLNEVYGRFILANPYMRVVCQRSGMTEMEKENFLNEFSCTGGESLVGFAVMGGIFGEGIDLTGERLSGAVIVGVGLPQICLERDIIRNYYEESRGAGFEYAYVFPGMNKVLQAVGRVIRTEEDRGAVLLIDERFSNHTYKDLYPAEWYPVEKVESLEEMENHLSEFWSV